MPLASRVLAAGLAFAWGLGALAWARATLHWLALSPATSGVPGLDLAAAAGMGFAAGALWASPCDRAGFARRQLLAMGLCAGASATLSSVGPLAPLLVTVAAAALGASAAAPRVSVAPPLLGAAAGALLADGPGVDQLGLGLTSATAVALGVAVGLAVLASAARDQAPVRGPARGAPWSALTAGGLLGLWTTLAARWVGPYAGASVTTETVCLATLLVGLALGGARGESKPGPPARAITMALLAMIAVTAAYGELAWILPGAARRAGGLGSWPRAVGLVFAVGAALLLPVAIPLGVALGGQIRRVRTGLGAAALGFSILLVATPPLLRGMGDAVRRTVFEERYGALLYFAEHRGGTTLVTDDPEQGRIVRRDDGRAVGSVGTDVGDRVVAQIPLLLHPQPRRVLLVGFGAGNEASSILTHPIERLDVLDHSGAAQQTARFFDESNLDVLSDTRLVLIAAEPWSRLATSTESWDVILLSADHLESADGAGLPTLERLQLARRRLAPGGIVGLRLNVGRTSLAEIRAVVATMAAVFANLTLWEGPRGSTWILEGSDVAHRPRPGRFEALRQDAYVAAELVALGLEDLQALASRFVRGDAGARALAAGASLITTDRPAIPLQAARSADTFWGLGPAASDTALGALTDPAGRENVGLVRFFERLSEARALKEPGPP